MSAKKDSKDEHKKGGNNNRGGSRVTAKMYTITMFAWVKSQWHPLFLFGGEGGVGGDWAKDDDSGGSFSFEGKQHPQQQEQQ